MSCLKSPIEKSTHTFLMLAAYCFMAIFSAVLSNPKNDLMSILADCSKQVQSSFSGWTWKAIRKPSGSFLHQHKSTERRRVNVFRPCSSSVQWRWLCWRRSHCRPLCAVSSVCGPESSSEWNTRIPLLLSVHTYMCHYHHKACTIIKLWRIKTCQMFCTITRVGLTCLTNWHRSMRIYIETLRWLMTSPWR